MTFIYVGIINSIRVLQKGIPGATNPEIKKKHRYTYR